MIWLNRLYALAAKWQWYQAQMREAVVRCVRQIEVSYAGDGVELGFVESYVSYCLLLIGRQHFSC